MPSLLGDVRRFNRTVTEHIGVLSDHFLGRGLTPTEARLLWEIGPSGSELRSLRARLDERGDLAEDLLAGSVRLDRALAQLRAQR